MRTTKIWNISLPPDMAVAAENIAKEENRTKSELIREALRRYLWESKWQLMRLYTEKKAVQSGIKESDLDKIIHEDRKKRRKIKI